MLFWFKTLKCDVIKSENDFLFYSREEMNFKFMPVFFSNYYYNTVQVHLRIVPLYVKGLFAECSPFKV